MLRLNNEVRESWEKRLIVTSAARTLPRPKCSCTFIEADGFSGASAGSISSAMRVLSKWRNLSKPGDAMCEQCNKTKEIIAEARLASQIGGRTDIDRVLADIEQQILQAQIDRIFPANKQ
jgi:hypothetical protein